MQRKVLTEPETFTRVPAPAFPRMAPELLRACTLPDERALATDATTGIVEVLTTVQIVKLNRVPDPSGPENAQY